MLKILIALLIALLSPKESIKTFETPMQVSCIQMTESYGTYQYPSIYVTGLPSDLEITFYNGMTVFRFQGLGDNAIRAELPVGAYTVITYYGKEQVSNIYYFEIKSADTLMLHISIPEECYVKPVSVDKQA